MGAPAPGAPVLPTPLHACKCYRSSLKKLVTNNPSYKGKGGLTEKIRKRLTSAACLNVAARLLERDLNGSSHCFGYYDKCSPDFCSIACQSTERIPVFFPLIVLVLFQLLPILQLTKMRCQLQVTIQMIWKVISP